MTWTLAFAGTMHALTALVFLYVGYVLGRRRVPPRMVPANLAFAIFWGSLGVGFAVQAVQTLIGLWSTPSLALVITTVEVYFLLTTLSIVGLVYYLLYLFRGWRRAIYPIGFGYLAVYAWVLYLVVELDPQSVSVGTWSVGVTWGEPTGSLGLIVVLMLVLPPMLAAAAYLTLLRHVEDRTQRYRIMAVSGTILAWFGLAILGSVLGLGDHLWWQVVSRFFGLAAGLVVLSGYRPPAWLRERLDLEPVGSDPGDTEPY